MAQLSKNQRAARTSGRQLKPNNGEFDQIIRVGSDEIVVVDMHASTPVLIGMAVDADGAPVKGVQAAFQVDAKSTQVALVGGSTILPGTSHDNGLIIAEFIGEEFPSPVRTGGIPGEAAMSISAFRSGGELVQLTFSIAVSDQDPASIVIDGGPDGSFAPGLHEVSFSARVLDQAGEAIKHGLVAISVDDSLSTGTHLGGEGTVIEKIGFSVGSDGVARASFSLWVGSNGPSQNGFTLRVERSLRQSDYRVATMIDCSRN